jgi:hypothetical protein
VLLLVAVAVELLLLLLLVVAVAAVALRGAAGGGDGFFSSISGALSRSSVGASSFELSRAVADLVDPLSSSRPSSLISATDSELAVSTAGVIAASVFVVGDKEAVFSSATATSSVLGEVVGTRDDESSPIMVSSFISSSIFIMADSCDTTDNRGNERMKLRNYRLQTRGMDQSM